MRGLKSILFTVLSAVVAGGAFGQSDPKLTSTVVADPKEVSLSRNLGSTDEFIARAAYVVTIKNGAANDLNRALFTADTAVVQSAPSDTPVSGAKANFDAAVQYIHVSGQDPKCTINVSNSASLSCNFGDSQLAPGDTSEFILVVKAPSAGGRIKLNWTFGGDEGKGGGNGCCTKADSLYTDLVDSLSANSTIKTHVQSFMVKNVLDAAFTGISGGAATEADPWSTRVDLKAAYVERSFTKVTVDERETSNVGSCSPLNKNQCWLSDIAIPDTTWTATDPLIIRLDRHSSIIKNGSKLSNYFIQYSKTPSVEGSFTTLQSCSADGPSLGTPCVASCVEIPLTTKPSPFVWRCTINARDNGGYRVP